MRPSPPFHLLVKPTGARCNLSCRYCFYLAKARLYPEGRFRMSEEVLEAFIGQYLRSQQGPSVTIAWQGGEPALMGLAFFERAMELVEEYRRPGTRVEHTFQTNGTLLDDAWCRFFRAHDVLVGISLDGPRAYHDVFRVDRQGRGSFERVMAGLRLLQRHGVEHNLLACVHAANADHPREVYRFFRDEAGARFIQFIPVVEPDGHGGAAEFSVRPVQWGRFLRGVFDEWVRRDVGSVFVRHFDAALAAWAGYPPAACIFAPTCGTAFALEHTGDLYACDHFVDPDHRLGSIMEQPLADLAASARQARFGRMKLENLPARCLTCRWRPACHGECPKNRVVGTPGGEPGLNYLCEGYQAYFAHIDRPMRRMAALIRAGKPAAAVMGETAPHKSGS
ncbi:anaerobic sulfatase maturase [Methanofollis aquaemaris]|uniref:Anaerobic sulfatase maturase n=1 Tax=Methanofollis aquaemaris TaxID=126734 RepID=A0A8A3S382_9EURY|nr:anaerobic sulfatase maturase [Methanofollis aquaemaris]QSZ66373.1 anaerobic sulfatase maturase [Methanofollis aquaemaris]